MRGTLLFAIALGLVGFRSDPAQADCDPALVSLHNQYFDEYEPLLIEDSRSGNSDAYYYSSSYLHGIVSGLECTRDEGRLLRALSLFDNMIDSAIDRNGDGYLEWMNYYYDPSPFGEDQLGTWQALVPMARAAALIMKTSEFSVKYRDRAMRYVNYIHRDIINYWYYGVYGATIPYVEWGYPDANPAWWNDKASHFITINIFLFQATGDPLYLDIATRGGNAFRKRLQVNGTGWIWDNDGQLLNRDGNTEGVPDTSHSNREAMLAVFLHEAGLAFSDEDINRMGATLGDIIWNGSTTSPLFSNYINGGNSLYRNRGAWEYGYILNGWNLLARYHSGAMAAAMAELYQKSVPGTGDANWDMLVRLAMSGNLARSTLGAPGPGLPVDTIPPVVKIASPGEGAIIPR